MIELKNIKKNYYLKKNRIIEAVKGIDLNIQPGRIYGLLGPNGAGKTTTLRMLGTILKPTKGDILYNKKSIFDDEQGYKQKLGYISANTGIYGKLFPYEFVEYFGLLNGMDKEVIKSRFEYVARELKMGSILKTLCGKLSTGEKQKVSIARIMINDPEILVLDEPTLGLDVITSKTIVEFINKSKQKGKHIIMSTHVLSEAEYLCDDAGIIYNGEIVYTGSLKALMGEYKGLSLEEIFFKLLGENNEK
ncbi:ABC transporter ATP-binding protein [bacterium]|nr:ABC transporter ATP-binding protein [bacterium]